MINVTPPTGWVLHVQVTDAHILHDVGGKICHLRLLKQVIPPLFGVQEQNVLLVLLQVLRQTVSWHKS